MISIGVAIFAYNRPAHTKRLFESILKCKYSKNKFHFYIFSDSSKKKSETENILGVRQLINKYKKKIDLNIVQYKSNKGLYKSINYGIDFVLKKHRYIIVLEDDLTLDKSFFLFMEKALQMLKKSKFSQVSGYMYPIKKKNSNIFISSLTSCWGWGTSRKIWNQYKKFLKSQNLFNFYKLMNKNSELRNSFNFNSTYDYFSMLKKQIYLKYHSWGILFYTFNFISKKKTIFPPSSLVYNNGFDKSGVHTRSSYSLNKKNKYSKSQNIIFKENKKKNLLIDKDIELFFKANFSRRKKILNFMFELIR